MAELKTGEILALRRYDGTPGCKSCRAPDRPLIDRALLNGESYRKIAKQFGLSPMSIHRHARNCVITAVAETGTPPARHLAFYVRQISDELDRISSKCEAQKKYGLVIMALREKLRIAELHIKAAELERREELAELTEFENDPDYEAFAREQRAEFEKWKGATREQDV